MRQIIPDELGKSEGLAAIAVVILASLVGLLIVHALTESGFLQGLGMVVGGLFGGGAIAAFRDKGKPNA